MDKTISTTLKIIGILIVIIASYFMREIIGYLLLAFVFASALRPGVDLLQDKKIPRFLGGIIIFLVFLIFFAVIFWIAFPPLISEAQNFISTFPQYWQSFLQWLPQFEQWGAETPFGENIEEVISQATQNISQAFAGVFGFIYNLFGRIFNLLFVVIVAFYLAVERRTAERFSDFFFENHKELKIKILKYWQLAEDRAGRWLQGYICLGFIVGTFVYIGLSILGVKYALILAVLAGVLEIVPWLGPVFAGVVGFLFAFLQGGLPMGLWAVFIFFIVQQLENFLIVPLVMKNRVDLNPLLTLIVLLVGGTIGGFLGMILAVPITAILLAFWKEQKSLIQNGYAKNY